MTERLSSKRIVHRFKDIDHNNPETLGREIVRDLNDKDGEEVTDFIDGIFGDDGGLFDPDPKGKKPEDKKEEPFHCPFCGKYVKEESTFVCCHCRTKKCVAHLSKIVAEGPRKIRKQDEYSTIEYEAKNESLYCGKCWLPHVLPGRIGRKVWDAFMAPFVSIHRECDPQVQEVAKPADANPRRFPHSGATAAKFRNTAHVLIVIFSAAVGELPTTAHMNVAETWPKQQEVIAMSSQKEWKISQAERDELLKKAKMFGANLRENSTYGWMLCRKLQGEIDSIDPSDYWELKKVVDRAKADAINARFNLLIPFRPAPGVEDEVDVGDIYPLKTVETRIRTGVFIAELTQGCQVTGRSGSGKSCCLFQIIRGCAGLGLPCVLIDKKGNGQFNALARLFPGRVLILKIGRDVFYNPLYCRDIGKLIGTHLPIFSYVYERHDSSTVGSQALRLFERRQKLTGAIAPTFFDLIYLISEVRSPQGVPAFDLSLKRSLLTVIDRIVSGPLGVSTNVQKGMDFEEVIKQGLIVIVDTSELGPADEQYLVCFLLSDIREIIRNSTSIKSICGGKVVFAIDEASLLVGKQWDSGRHFGPLSQMNTLVRGSEILLLLGYHSIRNVSDITRANAYITISASLNNAGDVLAVKDAAFLTPAQAEALTHMPVGCGVMKMAGRFTHPFLVTWDPIPVFPAMSQDEIDANNAVILSHLPSFVPADFCQKTSLNVPTPSSTDHDPSVDRIYLLQHIEDQPFLNLTERAEAVVFPSGKKSPYDILKKMLENLRELGLCDSIEIRVKRGGRTPEYWFLTDTGIDVVGHGQKPLRGGTSHGHFFVQRLVCKLLAERGIHAQMEAVLGSGKQADIVCFDSGTVALEVAVSTLKTEPDQVNRDLAAGADRVLVVCLTKSDLTQLSREFLAQLGQNVDSRIKLCIPADIAEATSMRHIYECPALIYDPNWDKANRGRIA